MAADPRKQRRRIVPQLVVSPGADDRRAQLEEDGTGNEPAGPILLQKQREQSEWALEHLGPDRKVFLDLTDVAANKEVDWRKLLKDRGVQKPSKAAAKPADAAGPSDDPLLLRGRNGRQENMNTWTRMLAKLEATYCVGAGSDEESESDGWGDDSDSDAEEEGGEGGASKEEGEGGAGDGNTTGGEGGGKEGKEGGKAGRKRGAGDYDYFDEFIDDEEFLELLEHDKRKPKHTGFFIHKGEIERMDEMLPGFEELGKGKKVGKRKAGEEEGATDGEGAAAAAKEGKPAGEKKKRKAGEGAGEGGAVSEGDKPAKKKKKIVAEAVAGTGASGAAAPAGAAAPGGPAAAPGGLSVAQLARMAGQMAAAGVAPSAAAAAAAAAAAEVGEAAEPAGSHLSSPLRQQTQQASQAPASAKKKGPYEMPAAVRGAIEDIRRVAAQQEAPPLPVPGDKPKKRRVPRALGDAIDTFSPLFLQQETEWGRTATNRILEALEFLVPFIAKASLSQRLRNKEKPEKKTVAAAGAGGTAAAGAAGAAAGAAAPTVTTAQLRSLISAKVKAKPITSDDDFEPVQPRASTSPPTQATQAGDGSGAAPAASSAPAKPQAWKALDRAVKDQVYLYIKQRMDPAEDKAPRPMLLQEIYQYFPPNSIALDDLKEIWKAGRAKERRAEKLAAAAAAGQPAQAAGGEGGTQQEQQPQAERGAAQQAPAQQQQQQQQQPAQPGEAASAEALAFANLAVAAAEHKMGSPQQPQQQQQQQQQGAALSPAALAAALAAQAGGQQAAAGEGVPSAGGSPAPSPQAATTQLASPVVSQPPSQAGAPASGQPGGGQARQPPAYTDAQLVAKVKEWGGNEQDAWAVLQAAKSSVYAHTLTRVLMLAGPAGMGATQAARLAAELNLSDREMKQPGTNFSKAAQKKWIAHVGKSKYALRLLPGVVEVPKPKVAKDKKSGKASGAASAAEGSAAAGGEEETGGSPDEQMGEATEEAEVEEEEEEEEEEVEEEAEHEAE